MYLITKTLLGRLAQMWPKENLVLTKAHLYTAVSSCSFDGNHFNEFSR